MSLDLFRLCSAQLVYCVYAKDDGISCPKMYTSTSHQSDTESVAEIVVSRRVVERTSLN